MATRLPNTSDGRATAATGAVDLVAPHQTGLGELGNGFGHPREGSRTGPAGTGLGTFPHKADARESAVGVEAKAKRKAATDVGILSAGTSFGEWWEQLLDERTFESDTASKEDSIMNKHALPKWGDKGLNAIKRLEIKRWLATDLKVRPGMSPGYVHKIYGMFRLVMNAAVDQEVLDASPCVKIKLSDIPKKPMAFVTTSDADQMRPAFSRRASVYGDIVDVGLEVGMRPNELAGLGAPRVDRKRWNVHVVDVYVERATKMRGHPKDGEMRTGTSRPDAGASIRRQAVHERAAVRQPPRAAREQGCPPGALRRADATRAVEGGADVMQVKRSMGHADLDELSATPRRRRRRTTGCGPCSVTSSRLKPWDCVGRNVGRTAATRHYQRRCNERWLTSEKRLESSPS